MKQTLTRSFIACLLSWLCLTNSYAVSHSPQWEHLKPERNQVIASLNIVELLKRHHYNRQPLDKTRSQKTYDNYLKTLDPARIYFTAQDLQQFQTWRNQFERLLSRGDLEPGFKIYRKYLERNQAYLEYASRSLQQGINSIDFTVQENFETDREKAPWAANEQELQDLWRKRLKDEILRLKIAGKDDSDIQELLTKRYQAQIKRLGQTRAEDVFQTYINSFTQTYDPHTNYLSPESAENFDINMSLSLEGIGAVLQSDNENIKIVRLVPASPAEKSQQLAPADRIIAVGQGRDELVDVVGWRLDEVVKLIRGPKGSKVRLEIIPASNAPNDQSSKIVNLVREAVKLEEQAAQKHILELDRAGRKHRVGVIEIPTFYLDFKAYRSGDPNYKSTTRDVKKLIGELIEEGVEGIVIDLRNNGGGSLQEATELTGLFIEQGPTVQVRSSDGRVDMLSDEHQGVYYRGPLAVLVNRLSASASEIFAGAMQDYHRALVIGNQTFGKGTVQSIQPLNHGELKLTLAKFYRVSGKSTQHQGVLPDISYPADMDPEQIGESSLTAALPYDSITPAIRPPANPFKPFLQQLKTSHEQRTNSDADFIYKRERLQLSKQLMQDTLVSLNESQRRQQQEKIQQQQLELENKKRKAKGEQLLQKIEDDAEEQLEANHTTKKDPSKDAYLTEAARIMLDWISLHDTAVAKNP